MTDEASSQHDMVANVGGVSVEIARSAEKTTPAYLRGFLETNSMAISNAMREGNNDDMALQLRQFAEVLPTDTSFREIAALVARQANGNLFVTTVEGDIDRIDTKQAGDLIDEVTLALPVDTRQLLFLHTHPAQQSPIGTVPTGEVGFSQADESFLDTLGARLKVFPNLSHVSSGLATANSRRIVLHEGQNLGLAYGWQLVPPASPTT